MGKAAVITVADGNYLPDPLANFNPWDSEVLIDGTDGSQF